MRATLLLLAVAATLAASGCGDNQRPEQTDQAGLANATAADQRFAQRVQDLVMIRAALEAYHADHGTYPTTNDTWMSIVQRRSYNWLPELVPSYLAEVPRDPESSWDFETPQYVYISNGVGYKLIARKSGDCDRVQPGSDVRRDPQRSAPDRCWAYGIWTADYTNR